MEHLIVTGIVTRTVDYKENDRILTIFTREQGRVDARARGCRRAKSPLLPACQPCVYGEFQLFQMGGDKVTVDQCDVRESFFAIREDVERFAAAASMLSVVQSAIQPGDPNEKLFSLLYHGLTFLCYGQSHPVDMAICVLVRALDCIGFCPAITHCGVCGRDLRAMDGLRFSPASGGAVCESCAAVGGRSIKPLALEALRRMLLLEDGEMDRVKLPPQLRLELIRHLEEYCAYILEREQKSMKMLREFARKELQA